jgi:hypothetical protein
MKLYVPNPQVWVDYFDRVSRGKASLQQSGRGRRPRVISVTPSSEENNPITIKAVLPSEQTAAQAKTALEREAINPKSVEKAFQNLSGPPRRNRKRKSPEIVSSKKTKRSRGATSSQRQKKSKTSHGKRSKSLNNNRQRDIFEIN